MNFVCRIKRNHIGRTQIRRIQKRFPGMFLLALVFLFCICLPRQRVAAGGSEENTIRVLFIGNSKTRTNDIPGTFASLAESLGKSVKVTSVTITGESLSSIAERKSSKIAAKAYDYVVIQESTSASVDYSAFLKGAKAIAKLVRKKNPDVQIVVRKTWLKKTSSVARRKLAYRNAEKVAEAIGATVSEDGPAFDVCSSLYPSISLYKDTKHPSEEGAYLAACCVYAAIYGETPKGASYRGTLTAAKAKRLQAVAAAVTL